MVSLSAKNEINKKDGFFFCDKLVSLTELEEEYLYNSIHEIAKNLGVKPRIIEAALQNNSA